MAQRPATELKPGQRLDSTTDRVLSILDMFTEQCPVWTTDVLIDRLGVARATMYRYLRALVETGFLSPDGRGAYSLGPRFIEMDRHIRVGDPLLQVAPAVMEALRQRFAGNQLLCRYYGHRVLSIYEDKVDARIKSSFDRGRPFTLFRGSPSRIILANLTAAQLQRLFLHHAEEINSAGLGRNWLEFRENMRAVQKLGYAVASDIDKTLVGVSAAIFLPSGDVTASLCLVKLRSEVPAEEIEQLGAIVQQGAAEITKKLLGARAPSETAPAGRKRAAKQAAVAPAKARPRGTRAVGR